MLVRQDGMSPFKYCRIWFDCKTAAFPALVIVVVAIWYGGTKWKIQKCCSKKQQEQDWKDLSIIYRTAKPLNVMICYKKLWSVMKCNESFTLSWNVKKLQFFFNKMTYLEMSLNVEKSWKISYMMKCLEMPLTIMICHDTLCCCEMKNHSLKV